jgi:hypothetical protein
MTSRDRMLAAISGGESDYVPCSFMIFSALRAQSRDDLDAVSRQIALGLDPMVELATWGSGSGPDNADLPGPPLRFHPEVRVEEWVAEEEDVGPVIHRRYDTPDGPLLAVRWTRDPMEHVPLFDDWVIPVLPFLVETDEDLTRPTCSHPRTRRTGPLARAAPKLPCWGTPAGPRRMRRGREANRLCGTENLMWAALDRRVSGPVGGDRPRVERGPHGGDAFPRR